jgi:8-oxo-dGTP pyrophosphatase MutT (NUDIX family)
LREQIIERLRGTTPPRDLEAETRAALPPELAAHLFPRPFVSAAVLLPLIERPAGLTMLLTRRTDRLRDHPGQISLPGGRIDDQDTDPVAAALRETGEELGIAASLVETVGFLPPQPVISGFAVIPVVGFLSGQVVVCPDEREVAEVIEVPLRFFTDPRDFSRGWRRVGQFELPVCQYRYGSHRIWGATANIIRSFVEICCILKT